MFNPGLLDFAIDSASQYVLIDQSEPEFTVFIGVPKSIAEEKLAEIRREAAARDTLTLLEWKQFLARAFDYANAVLVRIDYPQYRVLDGLICLVASEKGSGSPWGLTWNGGIALTYGDYQHTREAYENYMNNPSAYQPPEEGKWNRTHPLAHLPFGDCAPPGVYLFGRSVPELARFACSIDAENCEYPFAELQGKVVVERLDADRYSLGGKILFDLAEMPPSFTAAREVVLHFVFFDGDVVVHEEMITVKSEPGKSSHFDQEFKLEDGFDSYLLVDF